MNNFHVGQKVVCVDDEGEDVDIIEVVKGVIYTVRWIGPYIYPIPGGKYGGPGICIRLEEIFRERCPESGELDVPFAIERFRPVVEHKTDISVFTRLLVPSDKEPVA